MCELVLEQLTRSEILAFTRAVITAELTRGPEPLVDPGWQCYETLQLNRGVFVTLEKGDNLRGCVGELFDHQPLFKSIRTCAVKAAFEDPRFPPMTLIEWPQIAVCISFLTRPQLVEAEGIDRARELTPHLDGVILIRGERRSTFLPRVWQQFGTPEEFLAQLCAKQGAPPASWYEPTVQLLRYRTIEVKEQA